MYYHYLQTEAERIESLIEMCEEMLIQTEDKYERWINETGLDEPSILDLANIAMDDLQYYNIENLYNALIIDKE